MPEFRYTNPIIRDRALSLRDHQILKVGETWYLTGTSAPFWTGPNPGVPLLVSRDLVHWQFHCWLIEAAKLPEDCPYRGRFWAPEIHAAHGRYWLTVNSGHRGPIHGERLLDEHNIYLFASDRVAGPYELVTLRQPLSDKFKNDASLFTDEDGRSYLYASGGGLWQAEIDLPRGCLAGEMQKIYGPRDSGNPDWMIGGIEGPFVIKRDGVYYLFFSAWTRGYEVGTFRAEHPLGPWQLTPNSPFFGTRKRRYREPQMLADGYAHLQFEDTADPFVEVGHCSVFTGPDAQPWLSCHYFLEGRAIVSTTPQIEYADTEPQLGFEPLHYANGQFSVNGPTWTEQIVRW